MARKKVTKTTKKKEEAPEEAQPFQNGNLPAPVAHTKRFEYQENKCPNCNAAEEDTRIVWTRPYVYKRNHPWRLRQHNCKKCGRLWQTYQFIDPKELEPTNVSTPALETEMSER